MNEELVPNPEAALQLSDFGEVAKVINEAQHKRIPLIHIVGQSLSGIKEIQDAGLAGHQWAVVAAALDNIRWIMDFIDSDPWIRYHEQRVFRYREIVEGLKHLTSEEQLDAFQEIMSVDVDESESRVLILRLESHHHHSYDQPHMIEADPPSANDGEKYWRHVIRQAKASGNIRQYLDERDIRKSTFYDWKKRLKL